MASVDDVQKFLGDKWTMLLWLDDKGFYRALAIDPAETTQHAMEQERQMGKGSQLSEALCNLVEKMADKPGSESDTTGTLLEVASGLVKWSGECMTDSPRPLLGDLVAKARTVLELVEAEKKVGER